MSTFSCPLVQIPGHGKHRNADSLRITQIEGSVCIFKEGAFDKGHLAVFIPVDAVVPLEHKAFAWLKDKQRPNKTHHRVKALRLRGVFSDGFLVPVSDLPDGALGLLKLGDDCSQLLGVTKYEEVVLPGMGGKEEAYGPDVPVYDIEPWKKFKSVFDDPTENVVITEKLHGANSRFAFIDGRLWVGSRNRFLYQDEKNMWWAIAAAYDLETKLRQHPNLVLYGETYGDVQDLGYGMNKGSGKREFRAFDIYDKDARKYLDYPVFYETCQRLGIPTVPVLYEGEIGDGDMVEQLTNPFNEDEKPYVSTLDKNTLREGVVIKPVSERWNYSTHRTILKHVSRAYLLRKGGTEAQ
jgi:RNA ligase (TIGR02306 family)